MQRRTAHHSATRSGSRSSPAPLAGSSTARKGEPGEQIGDAIDDNAIDHGRTGWNADEGKAGKTTLADLMGDADDFIIAHADRLRELAEDVAGCRACATQHVHIEVDVDRVRAAIRILERLTEAIDAELGTHLPHRMKMRSLAEKFADDLLVLEHSPLTDLDKVRYRDVVVELIHLALPAVGAGDARVHCQAVAIGGIPMRIKADHAYLPFRALGNGLGNGVGTAGGVLADDDRNRPRRQRVVDLCLDRRLGFEDVVDGRPIDDLRRKSSITIVDDLQMFEKVDV